MYNMSTKIYSLEDFAFKYNNLKKEGKVPYEIRDILCEVYGCRYTTYYKALKNARLSGLITDSYIENRNAACIRRAEDLKRRRMIENTTTCKKCETVKEETTKKDTIEPIVEKEQVKTEKETVNKANFFMTLIKLLVKAFIRRK